MVLKVPLDERVVGEANKLSVDINYSVQDIIDRTNKPYRWLIANEVVLPVTKAVEYLRRKGIEVPADTIRSHTEISKDGSPNRLEQELLKNGINRKVHRRPVGNIPCGVRLFTLAEVDLLGSL